ncbi:MAG: EcoRI family type II restriction endonuclease [Flavobacterium sp.]
MLGHLSQSQPLSQSQQLSQSISTYHSEGNTLVDDSKESESNLYSVITQDVLQYAQLKAAAFDATVVVERRLYSYDCHQTVKQTYPSLPDIPERMVDKYKSTYVQPDGGIMFLVTKEGKRIPILISEDKVQGTNDRRFAKEQSKQSTGNAIERGAKNMNFIRTLCQPLTYFPYVIFASGCDFHESETIPMRLVQMNHLQPYHYIDIGNREKDVEEQLTECIDNIRIAKVYGMDVATICIKAHAWNLYPHNSSRWKQYERIRVCKKIIDLALDELFKTG